MPLRQSRAPPCGRLHAPRGGHRAGVAAHRDFARRNRRRSRRASRRSRPRPLSTVRTARARPPHRDARLRHEPVPRGGGVSDGGTQDFFAWPKLTLRERGRRFGLEADCGKPTCHVGKIPLFVGDTQADRVPKREDCGSKYDGRNLGDRTSRSARLTSFGGRRSLADDEGVPSCANSPCLPS